MYGAANGSRLLLKVMSVTTRVGPCDPVTGLRREWGCWKLGLLLM